MADWVGPAYNTFYLVDDDGKLEPAVGGLVYHYIPGTDTAKDTWQDPDEATLNDNPIVLNERGEAIIYGNGLYRQRFTDADGNQIWDAPTGSPEAATPTPAPIFFDQEFEFLGPPPETNEVLALWPVIRALRIFADFNGTSEGYKNAFGVCLVLPTAEYVITVKKNNVTTVGTITISTLGAWVFSTSGVDIDLLANDYLVFVGQTAVDATLATMAWTIPGLVS